jgi:hypothetical protein
MKKVEYRVIPVTRYLVTRWHEEEDERGHACGSEERGEFNNERVAYDVAYALCKAEHDASGEPIDSMNFIYPKALSQPVSVSAEEAAALEQARAKFNDMCAQVSAQMTI